MNHLKRKINILVCIHFPTKNFSRLYFDQGFREVFGEEKGKQGKKIKFEPLDPSPIPFPSPPLNH